MNDREQTRRAAVEGGASLVEADATLADGRKVPIVQRDARLRKTWHVLFNCECRHSTTAHEAVAELDVLLAEFEQSVLGQAEAEARAEARGVFDARLASVPALVEALRRVENFPYDVNTEPETELLRIKALAHDALAVYEQSQGGTE